MSGGKQMANQSFIGSHFKPGTAGMPQGHGGVQGQGIASFGFVDVQTPVVPDAMQRIKMK